MEDSGKYRIGLMGGTFDPIHYGHLYIAECAGHKFELDKILFMPTGKSVHKKRNDIAQPEHRSEMTRLAVLSNGVFERSTMELDRPGLTYTVDTLEQLHREAGVHTEYYFITGADAILEILTWKQVDRIFELCQFIAVTRPGFSFESMHLMMQDLTEAQRTRIHFHQTTGILISSTEIRQRVRTGQPIKYLLPEPVERYIRDQGLYKSGV